MQMCNLKFFLVYSIIQTQVASDFPLLPGTIQHALYIAVKKEKKSCSFDT